MQYSPGDGPSPAKGWQGDGIDIEIARCPTAARPMWLWTLYDHQHRVDSGVSRSHRRAQWAGWWATLKYRWW